MRTKKRVSAEHLLKDVYRIFKSVPDKRQKSKIDIPLEDVLMSAFAVFHLKYPSLLKFEEDMKNQNRKTNFMPMYGVTKIPSDTQMREVLDEINPDYLNPAFKTIFSCLQRDRQLNQFAYYKKGRGIKYLLALDGTGYFNSSKVNCPSCIVYKEKGKPMYKHQMLNVAVVHPELKNVIALSPEPILKQDGVKKNDCESRAFERLIKKFRQDHPKLGVVAVADGLYSKLPHILLLKENSINFILSAKPGDHKTMFRLLENLNKQNKVSYFERSEKLGKKVKKKRTHKFRYIENIHLNNQSCTQVNFVEYWETTQWCGKRGFEENTRHFTWITDLPLSSEERVWGIMKAGRSRWKIENETINTLKNQGYNFEHNYGHGKKNLSAVFAKLMVLAFLFDQVQEIACPIFKDAISAHYARTDFFERIKYYYEAFNFDNWTALLLKIISVKNNVSFDTS